MSRSTHQPLESCLSQEEWNDLLEHRFDPQLPIPEGWEAVEAHMEQCLRCRTEAYSLDPTLAFQDLPEVAVEEGEVEEMQRSVALLIRNRELEGSDTQAVKGGKRPRWMSSAAALLTATVLGVLALTGISSGPGMPPGGESAAQSAENPFQEDLYGPERLQEDALGDFYITNDPVVEWVENPASRVYQYRAQPGIAEEESIAFALVIDPNIDV